MKTSERLAVLALAVLVATPVVAQGPSPVGDEQTRWWTHVKTLADDWKGSSFFKRFEPAGGSR